jgi:hypothetical protein
MIIELVVNHGDQVNNPLCKLSFVWRKNANLVYEVDMDMRFRHELANREFWITKLPRLSVLVTS